jgi:hypothetical protein
MPMPQAQAFAAETPSTRARDPAVLGGDLWYRIGRCPVCGTSVLVDDEFERTKGRALHAECASYVMRHPRLGAHLH